MLCAGQADFLADRKDDLDQAVWCLVLAQATDALDDRCDPTFVVTTENGRAIGANGRPR